MSESLYPIVNPQLEVAPLDSDAAEPMTVCDLPAIDGRVRYAIPSALVELIRLFDGRRTVDEAIKVYSESYPDGHSPESLKRLVLGFLLPKGLVVADADSAVEIRRNPSQRRSFLYIKLPLIPGRVVEPIARMLKWAYSQPVLMAAIPLFVLLHVYFYAELLPGHDLDFNRLHIGDILLLMILSTVGTFVHEFGHASAAAFYGCKRLEIGWGLYLVFTVLYTDVSDAWKLPRKQRAIVDLGGIYFQSFFLVAMVALFEVTHDPIYLFGFLFADLTIASSFNPFLRLDGYWLMTDIFGIINLRQQSLDWLRRAASTVLPIELPQTTTGPTLSRSAVVALVVYSLFGVAFFVFLLKVMIEQVAARIIVGYPEVLAEFWSRVEAGGMGGMEVASGLIEILWRTMMLVGLAFFLFSVLSRLSRLIQKGLARLRRRPSAVTPMGNPISVTEVIRNERKS